MTVRPTESPQDVPEPIREVVVVGGGIAGQSVCEELRARHADVRITMLCEETVRPYDRVNLSALLDPGDADGAADAAVERLALRPAEYYDDQGIELVLGDPVRAIDPAGQACTLTSGRALRYDRLVLATGSDALIPPIPGVEKPGVHPYRYPSDCEKIRGEAVGATRAAVIGGGLLGLEAARGLADLGCPTTVVHLVDRLMERQLDDGAAALLGPKMEALGVEVLLGRQTQQMLGEARVSGLRFADGSELECDLVVVSVGIRPRTDLARTAGLDVERGVVVDDWMRTSDPRILAVGECAQHRGVVYGIVAPIYEQAAIVAETIAEGARTAYAGSIMSAKLKVMGVDLVTVGDAEGPGQAVAADADAGVYRKLVFADGRVTGAVLVGDTRGYELLLDAVKTAREVSDPLGLLVEASQATAGDLPDAAQVCNCNGVCKGEIVDAIRTKALGSTQEVVATTRAGAGCGSCKPMVSELLQIELGGAAEEPTYLCPCRKLTREDVAGQAREQGWEGVSDAMTGCGAGRECGACKPGLSYLMSEVKANRHREERHARYINDRVHANIQNDGTFSVIPRIRGGVTSADELRRIADAADKYKVGMVKITGGQRIDLLGVRKQDLPGIWADLDMPSGHAYAKSVRTVKTCVGTDFCRFGIGDAIAAGIELERTIEGLHTPHKVKLAVSGCPRNCAESYVKDIGVVAVEGGWEIYVGGAAGSTVRKGDLLATVADKAAALELCVTFLQYYREHGEYLERTHGFLERVGLETIQAAVLDEASGEPARLRERFALAKAAADPDPWREGREPVHPRQFSTLDDALPERTTEPDGAEREAAMATAAGPPAGAQR